MTNCMLKKEEKPRFCICILEWKEGEAGERFLLAPEERFIGAVRMK